MEPFVPREGIEPSGRRYLVGARSQFRRARNRSRCRRRVDDVRRRKPFGAAALGTVALLADVQRLPDRRPGPVSSRMFRRAASSGVSPGSTPPPGINQPFVHSFRTSAIRPSGSRTRAPADRPVPSIAHSRSPSSLASGSRSVCSTRGAFGATESTCAFVSVSASASESGPSASPGAGTVAPRTDTDARRPSPGTGPRRSSPRRSSRRGTRRR